MRKGRGEWESEDTHGVYSRCEKQRAHIRGEKLNNEEDMEVNGLTDRL